MKHKVRLIIISFAAVILFCTGVFFTARYVWKLAGFSACVTARIESVSVENDCVEIEGSWPGLFPESFVGYHTEIKDGAVYVGFKYNRLLGVWIYDKGDFKVKIPTNQPITKV